MYVPFPNEIVKLILLFRISQFEILIRIALQYQACPARITAYLFFNSILGPSVNFHIDLMKGIIFTFQYSSNNY